jgi:hypothetical protein
MVLEYRIALLIESTKYDQSKELIVQLVETCVMTAGTPAGPWGPASP